MGLRGMLYRAARNKRLWTVATIVFIFYVNIIQMIKMAKDEEERILSGDSRIIENHKSEEEKYIKNEGDVGYGNNSNKGEGDEGYYYGDGDDEVEDEDEDEDEAASANLDNNTDGDINVGNGNKEGDSAQFGDKNKKGENEISKQVDVADKAIEEYKEENLRNKEIQNSEDSIYNGYYNLHEKVTKVILLTYQRAGSSFVGEMLTSGGSAMYVFEPLFTWRSYLGPDADSKVEEISAKVLGDLLDCKPEVMRAWRKKNYHYFRRKPQGVPDWCLDAKLRLLKTIRARKSFVLPWLRARPDIKVVHLVRDPRGILNSVKRGGNLWSENNRNAALQCTNMEHDLQLEELGIQRYLRVRYEDLVESPLEESRRIFSFMGVDFNDDVLAYLQEHTALAKDIPADKQGYLKTYRDSHFQHDHWKTNMDNREIEFIENVCGSVMKKLSYHPLPPT